MKTSSLGLTHLGQALAIEREVFGLPRVHWLAVLRGWAKENPEESERLATEVLALLRQRYPETHHEVTDARWELHNHVQQRQWTPQQRRLSDQIDDWHTDLVTHYQQGRFSEASKLADRILEARARLHGVKHPEYASALNDVAVLLQAQGDYQAALPLLRRALHLTRLIQGENHPAYWSTLSNLASVQQQMGDCRLALPLLQQAERLHREILGGRHKSYPTCLNNLAVVYREMNDYREALRTYELSVRLTRDRFGTDHPNYSTALNNFALAHSHLGNHAVAAKLYQEALRLTRATQGENHPDYLITLNNLGALHQSQQDYAGAREIFTRALELARRLRGPDHPDLATSYHNLATAHQHLEESAAACEYFQRALRQLRRTHGEDHPAYAGSLYSLAHLHREMGDPYRALILCEKSMMLGSQNLERLACIQSPRQQLAGFTQQRQRLHLWLSLTKGENRGHDHLLTWKGSILAREAQRRKLFASEDESVKKRLGELQTISRQLSTVALQTASPATRQARQNRLNKLTSRKERLEAELAAASEQFRLEQRRITTPDLAKLLPRDGTLIDFLVYTDPARAEDQRRIVAFVVRPDHPPIRVDLGSASEVARHIEAWRNEARRTSAPPSGTALRRLIWLPLASYLPASGPVLISPDGVLAQLPFGALPGDRPGSFLLEERAFSVVAVPRLLPRLLGDRPGAAASLLVIGDVDFGKKQPDNSLRSWETLPGTGIEADMVRARFQASYPGKRTTEMRHSRVTKSSVCQELSHHTYLHLATHGYFAPPKLRSILEGDGKDLFSRLGGSAGWHPLLLSGIVLSSANVTPDAGDEDRVLTALEINELDLSSVELAVLSACETGLGGQAHGEGVLGLQRAFEAAGARSVLTSLWNVNDAATSVLMDLFYDNLWRKKLPRLEALRQAQLTLLREPTRVTKRAGELRAELLKRGIRQTELIRRGIEDDAGDISGIRPVPGKVESERGPVAWWAGFVLSGDWR